jgi:predicted small lipoprotein YifL
MNNLRIFALALLLLASLLACGQRGPLYLPDESARPASPATAAPATDPLEETLEEEDDLQGGDLRDEQANDS